MGTSSRRLCQGTETCMFFCMSLVTAVFQKPSIRAPWGWGWGQFCGGQKKCWTGIITEWTFQPMVESFTVACRKHGGGFLLNSLSWPEDDFCWTVSHDWRMISAEPSLMTGGWFLLNHLMTGGWFLLNRLSWLPGDPFVVFLLYCWGHHLPLMQFTLPMLAFYAYPNACILCLLECPQTVL